MRTLSNVFNSLCTIGLYEITVDTRNQPIEGIFNPSDIPALNNIRCYKEPLIDQEAPKTNQVVITNKLAVALQGYYPQIRDTDFCMINETVYNVRGVVSDDTDTITYLNVEIVNNIVDNR